LACPSRADGRFDRVAGAPAGPPGAPPTSQ